MSLMDNNNGMVMPVSPMYGNGGYGNRILTAVLSRRSAVAAE